MQQHKTRPSLVRWFWHLTLSFGLLAPWVALKWMGTRYEVTEDRVIKHTGLLRSATDEFNLEDVQRVKTSQSVIGKLVNVGTVTVDAGVDQLTLTGISDYDTIAETIREQSR